MSDSDFNSEFDMNSPENSTQGKNSHKHEEESENSNGVSSESKRRTTKTHYNANEASEYYSDGHDYYSDESQSSSQSSISKTSSIDSLYNEKGEFIERTERKIDKVLSHRYEPDKSVSFLVKFVGKSYRSSEWIHEPQDIKNQNKIKKYLSRNPLNPPSEPFYPPKYDIPEKILAHRIVDDKSEYLVLWTDLDREEATWELEETLDCKNLISEYNAPPAPEDIENKPKPPASAWKPLQNPPKSKSGKTLYSYQLDGLNFLINSWYKNHNSIIADEMGLGKTAQVCTFLDYLYKSEHQYGPFLIIVPLSTLDHWYRELTDWADLKILILRGTKSERELIFAHELYYEDTTIPRFQVLLTTSEIALKSKLVFQDFDWQVLIFDEAHRLKSHTSKLLLAIKDLSSHFKVLMTGTPLQNNINELFTLLNFIEPQKFDDRDRFNEQFADLSEKKQILELKKMIQPLMLRRLKGDVEKKLIPLEEIIIECEMTKTQREYYKAVLSKNREFLTRCGKMRLTNLNNISMELRKVCNHPYLIAGAEDAILIEKMQQIGMKEKTNEFELETLIRTSGKLILVDKLLAHLKAEGHRVLIFSQMTKMLDLIQDMLAYREYKYRRIDGTIRGKDRQASIDDFQEQDDIFVFLLCTRAGGVGINLTSADRCIIYDSDWNPQNDIQATARCHRIGQTKEVKMYRLITKNTYERIMFGTASRKLGLDKAILENDSEHRDAKELEKMIKIGAYHAFEDEENATDFNEQEDILEIIKRSEKHIHDANSGQSFSKLSFNISEDEDEKIADPNFWQKYLGDPEQENKSENELEDRRPRRSKSSYFVDMSDSDEEEEMDDEDSEAEESDNEQIKEAVAKKIYNAFNKKVTKQFVQFLTKFGFSRANEFVHEIKLDMRSNEMLSIARVFLRWMIKNCDTEAGTFPLVEKFIREKPDYFEQGFTKIRGPSVQSIITENSKARLNKIQVAEYVYQLCSTANDVDDIAVPNLTPNLTPTWTQSDDRRLLKMTWEGGYGEVTAEMLGISKDIETWNITERVRQLIFTMLQLYNNYKSRQTGYNIAFSNSTIKKSLDQLNAKEHEKMLTVIQDTGIANKKLFMERIGIKNRSPEFLFKHAEKLTRECELLVDGIEINQDAFPKRLQLSKARQVVITNAIMNNLQKSLDEGKLSAERREVAKLVLDCGFESAVRNGVVQKYLNPLPYTVDYLQDKLAKQLQIYPIIPPVVSPYSMYAYIEDSVLPSKSASETASANESGDENEPSPQSNSSSTYTKSKSSKPASPPPPPPPPPPPVSSSSSTSSSSHAKSSSKPKAAREPKYMKPIPKSFTENTEVNTSNGELPLHIGSCLVIKSLGKIVYDREAYHNERYAYPVGFVSEHLFSSPEDPKKRVWYQSLILDGGEKPIFRVRVKDEPDIFYDGNVPSNPWLAAIRTVEERKRQLGMQTCKNVSVSGPGYYGLSSSQVMKMIMKLPNVDKLKKLKKIDFEELNEPLKIQSRNADSKPEPPEKKPVETKLVEKKPVKSHLSTSMKYKVNYKKITKQDVMDSDDAEAIGAALIDADNGSSAEISSSEFDDSPLLDFDDESDKEFIDHSLKRTTVLTFDFSKLIEAARESEIHIKLPPTFINMFGTLQDCL